MDQTEQDRGLGERAMEAFNNAAEKTKAFAQQLKEKVIGEQENPADHDQVVRDAVEQKQKLDLHLFESASAPPNPELAKCHEACACPDCAYARKPVQQSRVM